MPDVWIEVTNDTLVLTEQGVEKLSAILHRPVGPALWAIKWCFNNIPNGISFHKNHKQAKQFAAMQIDSVPDGPARLIDVSDYLVEQVQKFGYCWTNLNAFEEAKDYMGEDKCKSH